MKNKNGRQARRHMRQLVDSSLDEIVFGMSMKQRFENLARVYFMVKRKPLCCPSFLRPDMQRLQAMRMRMRHRCKRCGSGVLAFSENGRPMIGLVDRRPRCGNIRRKIFVRHSRQRPRPHTPMEVETKRGSNVCEIPTSVLWNMLNFGRVGATGLPHRWSNTQSIWSSSTNWNLAVAPSQPKWKTGGKDRGVTLHRSPRVFLPFAPASLPVTTRWPSLFATVANCLSHYDWSNSVTAV